jgi:hypothetical protein
MATFRRTDSAAPTHSRPVEFSRSVAGKQHSRGRVHDPTNDNQIIIRRPLLGSELRERGLHGFGVPVEHDPENPLLWASGGPGARLLLDHLVGPQPNRWGHLKTKRLGGLEVQDHLELGRKLHREIARLRAAQNAIDIGGRATKVIYLVNSVGEQAAVSGKVRHGIDRRYVVSGRRRYDRRAMHDHEYIRHDDKAASRLAPKGHDGRFDFYVAMYGRSYWHDLE